VRDWACLVLQDSKARSLNRGYLWSEAEMSLADKTVAMCKSPWALLTFGCFVLFLILQVSAASNSTAVSNVTASKWDPIGNFLDPGTSFFGFWYQFFPATTANIFPFTIIPRLNPSIDFYKLDPCARADIATCLPYGMHLLD
jgi:hypothetical protein